MGKEKSQPLRSIRQLKMAKFENVPKDNCGKLFPPICGDTKGLKSAKKPSEIILSNLNQILTFNYRTKPPFF